jgi:hypothetical protein
VFQWFSVFDAHGVFKKYAADNSGELGPNELSKVLEDLGLHVGPSELLQAVQLLDKGIVDIHNIYLLILYLKM